MPICKVGSNSFFIYFSKAVYDDDNIKELELFEIRNKMTEEFTRSLRTQKSSGYFTFAFVRNPWSRMVSAYKELIRMREFGGSVHIDEKHLHCLPFERVYELMDKDISFNSFVTDFPLLSDIVNLKLAKYSKK